MMLPDKCFYVIILFFLVDIVCDDSEDVDMSLLRFSTKNPYFFKPIEGKNYFNAEIFTPKKIWAIYR